MSIKNSCIANTGFIVLILATITCSGYCISVDQSKKSEIWLDGLKNGIEISEQDGKELVQSIARSLYGDKKTLRNLPKTFQKDTSPRIVFLSVSDSMAPAFVTLGSGKGLIEAVEQALVNLQKELPENYYPKWVKLDLVNKVYPVEDIEPYKPLSFERSLNGIAFERGNGLAFLPEELVANTLVDSRQRLRPEKIAGYLEGEKLQNNVIKTPNQEDPIEIHRFTLDSYFYDGDHAYRLYRGHRMFEQISSELLIEAAIKGGEYLARSVRPDGSFTYIYMPKTDVIPGGYNILRHAGTVYSMLELYEITQDEELLIASKRAIDYLLRSIRPCNIGDDVLSCVVEDDIVKLGGNALAIIALAKYIDITDGKEHMPVVINLARWIQKSQRESGEFFPHKKSYPDGRAFEFISEYYPGEALLALTRIFSLKKDESFIDTAEKGAQYLIKVRDKDLPLSELNHDHWLLYTLNELYRYRPNPLYVNHSMRIAKSIVQSQNVDPPYPDWFGSYYQPPHSTPTATRSEGLYAAYKLARDFGDPQQADDFLKSIEYGIRFQLQTQFRPESVLYLKSPQRSLGGFHRSLTNFEIRNDYVQHNISSILGLYRLRVQGGNEIQSSPQSNRSNNNLKILFAGDTYFGESYQMQIKLMGRENILETKGYDYPLKKLKPILFDSDFVIVNLEAPITNLSETPLSGRKNYIHRADPEKTPKKLEYYNIKAVSLANNHTLDYGIQGLKQTIDNLNKNNIAYFGAGLNETEAEKPYIKELKIGEKVSRIAIIGAFESRDVYNRDYNFYAQGEVGGANSLSPDKISKKIREIKAAKQDTFIVVFPHWGENYSWKSEAQTVLAQKFIDAGADLIVGHGAHMMQEVEKYGGHWIIYNLGNFMFNSKGRYQKLNVEPFSLVAQLIMIAKEDRLEKKLRLYPIFTDNLTTNYQSRFLTKDEFDLAYRLLLNKSDDPPQLRRDIRTGNDDIGRFMEISM